MALARLDNVCFAYPRSPAQALDNVTLAIEEGQRLALLGPSGSGKSTLLRALAGLVPHFHGGRFSGRVVIAGLDTRRARPADLAGTVATVFQDPEDQVVMALVLNEVAFGLENLGTPPDEIVARAEQALAAVDALHLAERRTSELSGGELQRVCLASALALRPRLLLLDEPTSQLDPAAAELFLDALSRIGCAVVLSEHRVARALELADRVLFFEEGRLLLDAAVEPALEWLAANRPHYLPADRAPELPAPAEGHGVVLHMDNVSFAFGRTVVLEGVDLEVAAGEVVALQGRNGAGKTTLAKIAAGLLDPAAGTVRRGRSVCYLAQDPGRYLVRERVDQEVALGVAGDLERAALALRRVDLDWAAARHPRDLSSGERERLGLAAVAASEPGLLVLDEPTRGVDPERKEALAAWLAEYAARGNAVLVATHDRTFPAHRRVSLGVREVAHA